MSQLKQLSKPFHESLVEKKPGKGDLSYVSHSVVTERALATLGPFSLETKEVIYRDGKVDGVLVTLVCEIDGRTVRITEAGEGDNPTAKTNGALLKDAISDAVKRCFMRTGLGLHLWSGNLYNLDKVLERNEKSADVGNPITASAPEQNSTKTPTQPPKEEPKLSYDRAQAMLRELDKLGFSEEDTLELVAEVVHKGVVKLTELTDSEALQVWNVARRRPAKPAEVKAPYETWASDDDARKWAAGISQEHGIFRGGHELMLLWDEIKAGKPENLYREWQQKIMERADTAKKAA